MKKIISLFLVLCTLLCLASCSKQSMDLKVEDIKDVVEIEMSVKGHGKMTLELYHDIAPATVENFVKLTTEGFYDGTVFHRIMNGFMIQGGDDNGDGISSADAKTIKGEFSANGFNNTLKHERGVISMARTSDPNSASSQFFIMHADNAGLDGNYAAFGMLKDGFDTLDSIATSPVSINSQSGERSVPVNEIVLDYVIITGTYDRDGADAADNTKPAETKSEEELYANPVKVEMSVKDYGKITLEVYPNLAPITVSNFLSLAKSGYYEGSVFHRIIEDFMIQGGEGDDSAKSIKGEFSSNGVYNPLKHDRGVISMARTNVPDSASSQFFIMHKAAPHLDGQYAAFGKVIEGIEVVDEIAVVDTNASDAPYDEIVIEYVKVLEETETTTDATETTDVTETTSADTTSAAEIK